jgi:hypothetical protein
MLLVLLFIRGTTKGTDLLVSGLFYKQKVISIAGLAGAHPDTSLHIRNASSSLLFASWTSLPR